MCADETLSERLDASYDWLPAPPGQSQPLVGFGDGCSDPLPYGVAGKVGPPSTQILKRLAGCARLCMQTQHACLHLLKRLLLHPFPYALCCCGMGPS